MLTGHRRNVKSARLQLQDLRVHKQRRSSRRRCDSTSVGVISYRRSEILNVPLTQHLTVFILSFPIEDVY